MPLEIETKITIDLLSVYSVSVKKERFYENERLGEPERRVYTNSPFGRKELEKNVEDPYYSAVMEIWGEEPVLEDVDLNNLQKGGNDND